jgi:hypothetical protein
MKGVINHKFERYVFSDLNLINELRKYYLILYKNVEVIIFKRTFM